MQKISEKYIKRPNGKFILRTIQEEEVILTLEELERVQANCDKSILRAQRLITEMQEKKTIVKS